VGAWSSWSGVWESAELWTGQILLLACTTKVDNHRGDGLSYHPYIVLVLNSKHYELYGKFSLVVKEVTNIVHIETNIE